MRRDKGCAESVEDAGSTFFFVEMGRADIREFVIGECDIEGCDEEVECLSRGVFVDGSKGGHFGFVVECAEPRRKWRRV